ncbi:MAG: hypothetical protein V4651_04840 [Bacteroidota bacterium]
MNPNKPLIIQLLIADMKHEQLLAGLSRLGFESDWHSLDLSGVVAELMGIPEADRSGEWFEHYMDFVGKAGNYPVTATGNNLQPLAEACYEMLQQ